MDDLQKLVNNYNTTKRSSTGYTPHELYERKQYDSVICTVESRRVTWSAAHVRPD